MTVRELKDYLSQYPDDMKVMSAASGIFENFSKKHFMICKTLDEEFLAIK